MRTHTKTQVPPEWLVSPLTAFLSTEVPQISLTFNHLNGLKNSGRLDLEL